MQVLKQGEKKPSIKWYGKCFICDAIISAESSELDYPYPETEHFVTRSCPQCPDGIVYFYAEHTKFAQKFIREST